MCFLRHKSHILINDINFLIGVFKLLVSPTLYKLYKRNVIFNEFILFVLQSLLDEPNPNSPANSLAAQLYQENRREYEKRVATIVEQSWLNFNDDEEKEPKKDS